MTKALVVALLVSGLVPAVLGAQAPTPLQRVLEAEDARGKGPDSIAPLLAAARGDDSLLRLVAVRGLGRLQRPGLIPVLLIALRDRLPSIRAEAANAAVQSLAGQPRGAIPAEAVGGLLAALDQEPDTTTSGAIAVSLGRLRYADTASARRSEAAILSKAGTRPGVGVVHGLYWLALSRRATGPLTADAVALLRRAATSPGDTLVQRAAVLALTTNGTLDSATALAAFGSGDPQVRRLSLAVAASLGPAARGDLAARAMADTSAIVRIAAVAAARAGSERPACAPIVPLTRDANDYVALTAIDALGQPCNDAATIGPALEAILSGRTDARIPDHAWQRQAHALVALARADSGRARAFLPRFAGSPRWQLRVYAANAAGPMRDEALLRRLAGDRDDNVREAAVGALAHNESHLADDVFIAALAARGYQAQLAAAQALRGTHDPSALPALLTALRRVTIERRENARDPRLEMLKRINELGDSAQAPALEPYLADFDTSVAQAAAGALSRWTGRTWTARPAPLRIRPEPLADILQSRGLALRVTMARSSGGGRFTIALMPDLAPATVARVVRLARAHFYDGHVFQRVEPNFVIQGGGPAATEYVGDGPFMRDELGRASHLRGTLGISSRGRDTGDAQWFINLTDNIRLDHEYTVFGWISAGLDVAERILEDDVIAKVEVLGRP